MRRQIIWIVIFLLGTVAIASANSGETELVPERAAFSEISGQVSTTGLEMRELVPIPGPNGTDILLATEAKDICSEAEEIEVPGGGQTTVNNFSGEASDPILSCMWDSPLNPRGNRTAWYKYTANQNELIRFRTTGSTFDTVIAVVPDSCGQPAIACNDDFNFFTSQLDVPVIAGETYYVEVADWFTSSSGQLLLNMATEQVPSPNNWQVVFKGPSTQAQRSRHATAVVGDKIYAIAGFTGYENGSPVRRPWTDVYNTNNGQWTSLANMPGGDDQLGYANTTAAYVDGKIYLPSGDVGLAGTYSADHWVYNIAANNWSANPTNNNWAAGGPTIFSVASAYELPGGNDGYYLSGGLTGLFPPEPPLTSTTWTAHDEVYFYSATQDSWSNIPSSIPTPRFGHVASILSIGGRDNLCVAGGQGEDPGLAGATTTLSSVQCLDIDLGNWRDVAPLNYPRYFADSAVGNDGNWYVFGGYKNGGEVVWVTERYDASQDKWISLDIRFDLGVVNPQDKSQPARPARAWPRGGFVGDQLFAVGGEFEFNQLVNLVERVNLSHTNAPTTPVFPVSYLPTIMTPNPAEIGNNTFATADSLPLNVARQGNFKTPQDTVDVWRFSVPSFRKITIRLKSLESNNEQTLYLFNYSKGSIAVSATPGTNDEIIIKNLAAGQYFAVVERIFPTAGNMPDTRPYEIIAQD